MHSPRTFGVSASCVLTRRDALIALRVLFVDEVRVPDPGYSDCQGEKLRGQLSSCESSKKKNVSVALMHSLRSWCTQSHMEHEGGLLQSNMLNFHTCLVVQRRGNAEMQGAAREEGKNEARRSPMGDDLEGMEGLPTGR